MRKFFKLWLTLESKSSIIIDIQEEVDMAKKVTLKELRARMDWTQEETAKKLGVSLQTYNAWEQDFGKVKISSAYAVANLFHVGIDDIFFDHEDEENSNELDEE